ncbi:hypothetical protein ACFY71_35990 [Streptomyces cinerochromogenes]|uniref:hypothetical protein n=1 Tax=Streptomyces cinerochromogenes TaxID=66422 RepID=UPI0036C066E4
MLQLVSHVEGNAMRLAAAAAAASRAQGDSWKQVATAAGITEASARARWGGAKAARLIADTTPVTRQRTRPAVHPRLPLADSVLLPATGGARERARMLGRALQVLRQRSERSIEHLAQSADVPVTAVCMVLEGEAVAPWPLTYLLTDRMGGEPQDLRWLWQRAWYGSPRSALSGDYGDVQAILRGAHVAAGAPELPVVADQAGLTTEEAAAILDGSLVPDWPVLCRLAACLGADPDDLTPVRVPRQERARLPEEGRHDS